MRGARAWGAWTALALGGAATGCADATTASNGAQAGGIGGAGGATGAGGAGGGGGAQAGGAGAGGMAGCAVTGDCPPTGTACVVPTCVRGACGTAPAVAGTPCAEAGGNVCDGAGACKKKDGTPCADATGCLHGFCTDGVCCDAACAGTCESCNAPGSAGACTPFAAATDPEDECSAGVAICDGASGCSDGRHRWSRPAVADVQDDKAQRVVALGVDGIGNVVAFGDFEGKIELSAGNPLVASGAGTTDVWIAKLKGDGGATMWSKRAGNVSSQTAGDVAVSSLADVALTGFYVGPGAFNLGCGTLSQPAGSGQELYVARFDTNGTCQWSKRFGSSANEWGRAVALGPAGEVVVFGEFDGSVTFDGTSTFTTAGQRDLFVVALEATQGNHVWSKSFGDAAMQRAADVAVDPTGAVALAGGLAGSVSFGGAALTSGGGEDAFVVKLDSGGGHLWSRAYGDAAEQRAHAVALDGDGNVIVAGSFAGSITFKGTKHDAVGRDAFVMKLDANGAEVAFRQLGGAGDQDARAVAADAGGNVVVSGDFATEIDLGGGGVPSAGMLDAFVAKLSQDLATTLWSHRHGGTADESARALGVAPSGAVVTGGWFASASIDVGDAGEPHLLLAGGAAGDADLYVVSYEP
jgi:hypothetical protein